jgi:hypothetical protein
MDTIPQNIPTKQCNKCKENLPASPQYFYENKKYSSGLKARCKECERTTKRKTPRIFNEHGKIQCTMCKEWKLPTSEFFSIDNKTLELRSPCRTCNNKKAKEREAKKIKKWHHAKPDAKTKICSQCKLEKPLHCFYPDPYAGILKRASSCSMCQNPLKPENLKQRMLPLFKTCYICKKEKVNQEFYESSAIKDYGLNRACKECCSVLNEQRKKRKQEKNENKFVKNNHRNKWLMSVAEYNARQKAIIMNSPKVEKVDYYQIFQEEKMCYICKKEIFDNQFIAFDHVHPLAKNGTHTKENIKITHFICNARKSAILLSEMTEFQRRGV